MVDFKEAVNVVSGILCLMATFVLIVAWPMAGVPQSGYDLVACLEVHAIWAGLGITWLVTKKWRT